MTKGSRSWQLALFAVLLVTTLSACGAAPAKLPGTGGEDSPGQAQNGMGPMMGSSSGAGSGFEVDEQMAARGQELYAVYCQACHGANAEGERPDDPRAVDAAGNTFAPALNGSMHSWHHTDDGLVQTILLGSPRNPRMQAWGDAGLAEADARAIVEYMKSMWGEVQRSCQGPLHMDRDCITNAMNAGAN